LRVAAGKTGSQKISEERVITDRDQPLQNVGDDVLESILNGAGSSAALKSAADEIMSLRKKLADSQEAEKRLKAATGDQARLRANLTIIPQNAEPYKQFLQKFVTRESEIEALRHRLRELQSAVHEQQKAYDRHISQLTAQ
jgi:multidrug resistance efflux pump